MKSINKVNYFENSSDKRIYTQNGYKQNQDYNKPNQSNIGCLSIALIIALIFLAIIILPYIK